MEEEEEADALDQVDDDIEAVDEKAESALADFESLDK